MLHPSEFVAQFGIWCSWPPPTSQPSQTKTMLAQASQRHLHVSAHAQRGGAFLGARQRGRPMDLSSSAAGRGQGAALRAERVAGRGASHCSDLGHLGPWVSFGCGQCGNAANHFSNCALRNETRKMCLVSKCHRCQQVDQCQANTDGIG